MSENTMIDVKSLLSSDNLGFGGIASYIPAGSVIDEFSISKLKLDPQRKTRIAFLTDGGLGYQQHYLKGFGTILCDQGECCKHMASNPDVDTTRRILFPVLVYEGLADPVRAIVSDIGLKNLRICVWSVHFQTYNKRMADSFANGDIMTRDWILTPTTGQFAGGLESMAGSSACLYQQVPEFKKWVSDKLSAHVNELFDAVGVRFSIDKYRSFLNGGQVSNVQASAPAIPASPVDIKAIEGNFVM